MSTDGGKRWLRGERPEVVAGEAIRAARLAMGISQREVGERVRSLFGLTLSQTQVAKIENGKRPLRVDEASALAFVLGSTVGDLLGETTLRPTSTAVLRVQAATRERDRARAAADVADQEVARAVDALRNVKDIDDYNPYDDGTDAGYPPGYFDK